MSAIAGVALMKVGCLRLEKEGIGQRIVRHSFSWSLVTKWMLNFAVVCWKRNSQQGQQSAGTGCSSKRDSYVRDDKAYVGRQERSC